MLYHYRMKKSITCIIIMSDIVVFLKEWYCIQCECHWISQFIDIFTNFNLRIYLPQMLQHLFQRRRIEDYSTTNGPTLFQWKCHCFQWDDSFFRVKLSLFWQTINVKSVEGAESKNQHLKERENPITVNIPK